jgi:uncharacterized membrane-anchored protein
MTLKVDYELCQQAQLLRSSELSILSKIRELERTQLTTMLVIASKYERVNRKHISNQNKEQKGTTHPKYVQKKSIYCGN